jgi:preprotein translocase subunit YajC
MAPALTLLTLAGAVGVILDTSHRTALLVFTAVVVVASMLVFIAQRILKRPLDWRLSAPLLLGVAALAAESTVRSYGFQIAAIFAVMAVLTYFFGRRERRLAAAAEANSSASLQIAAAFVAFVAAAGGTYAAPVVLIAATVWLLVWMPSRTRRVHDQDILRVARTPEEVSAYLLDQRHLPLWYPGYVSSELLNGHDLSVGATFRQVVRPRGHAMEGFVTVDEYEPGRRICSHVIQTPGHGRSCYSFTPDGSGTIPTYDFDMEQPYPPALIGGVAFLGDALRKMRAQRRQAFDQLKSVLEA